MLKITVPENEIFLPDKNEFINTKEQTLSLEHSLVSISKWESKFHKPFLKPKDDKTNYEIIEYVKCMTCTQNVSPYIYLVLSKDNLADIGKYIEDPMTATTFYNLKKENGRKETVTSELIYYWMFSFNIPKECEKWHINRLLTLIQIFSIKNSPDKKMSKNEIYKHNRELNALRRKKLGTKG